MVRKIRLKNILYWGKKRYPNKNKYLKKKKQRELGINKPQFYLKNMNLIQIKIRI